MVGKDKAMSIEAWIGREGSRRLKLPEFLDDRPTNVTGLSALHTSPPLPPLVLTIVERLSRTLDHSAAGRINL